jgi:hypothetical protein
MITEPKFAVGTKFNTRHKPSKLCTVIDIHTTRNLAGEVVKIRYVATHELMGQTITDSDVVETTIAMGLVK